MGLLNNPLGTAKKYVEDRKGGASNLLFPGAGISSSLLSGPGLIALNPSLALNAKLFGGLPGLTGGGATKPGYVDPNRAVTGFTTPGLSGAYNRETGSFDITRSPGLTGLLNSITGRSEQLAGDIGGLIPLVSPGVSELRRSRLAGLENRRRKAIGNLQQNLSRRRIMGSSFANNALTQAELAYQEEADRIRAESTLTEMEQSLNLYQQQAQAQLQGMNVMLSQFNIDAQLASQLSTSATNAIQQALMFNQEMAFKSAEGEKQRDSAALMNLAELGTGLAFAGGL